jgi:hypothetical protein
MGSGERSRSLRGGQCMGNAGRRRQSPCMQCVPSHAPRCSYFLRLLLRLLLLHGRVSLLGLEPPGEPRDSHRRAARRINRPRLNRRARPQGLPRPRPSSRRRRRRLERPQQQRRRPRGDGSGPGGRPHGASGCAEAARRRLQPRRVRHQPGGPLFKRSPARPRLFRFTYADLHIYYF